MVFTIGSWPTEKNRRYRRILYWRRQLRQSIHSPTHFWSIPMESLREKWKPQALRTTPTSFHPMQVTNKYLTNLSPPKYPQHPKPLGGKGCNLGMVIVRQVQSQHSPLASLRQDPSPSLGTSQRFSGGRILRHFWFRGWTQGLQFQRNLLNKGTCGGVKLKVSKIWLPTVCLDLPRCYWCWTQELLTLDTHTMSRFPLRNYDTPTLQLFCAVATEVPCPSQSCQQQFSKP